MPPRAAEQHRALRLLRGRRKQREYSGDSHHAIGLLQSTESSRDAEGGHGWLCRAAELFDWLRQLPETHELAHLCDVYTYTTAISHVRSAADTLQARALQRTWHAPCTVTISWAPQVFKGF